MRGFGPRRGRPRNDRGYLVVLLAVVMSTLVVMAAIVIDFSFLRDDRRTDQKVTDTAATSGAVALAATTNGATACRSVIDNVIANLEGVTALTGADCTTFPDYCDATTPSTSTTGTSGSYTVTIVHPVEDGHRYMTTGSAIGTPARSVTPGDGNPCKRIGVEISLERGATFGSIVDDSARSTSVHTVALANTAEGGPLPINLLILERTECNAIWVDGTNANLVIAPIIKDGVTYPGVLAVESDGSGDSCTTNGPGTMNVQSGSARSDGPPGCAAEVSPDTGHGCGDMSLYAPGVPGSPTPGGCKNDLYRPACTSNSSGRIVPNPARMGSRYTRGAVDHMFNCKTSYASEPWFAEHPVNPCFQAIDNSNVDYIDELTDFARSGATPPSFRIYGDDTDTEPCAIEGPVTMTVPEQNVHVVCSPLEVKAPMTFNGGNIIFDGDVVIESNGVLTTHACGDAATPDCNPAHPLTPLSWAPGENFDERQYSSDAAWIVFRDGATMHKAGGGSVYMNDTMMVLARDADYMGNNLSFAGGSGALHWGAPWDGPFANMALWSEAPLNHDFAGQASLDLEGVYFAPVGGVTYRGTGSQEQLQAQFITERLRVTGNGELIVAPNTDRSISHMEARSTLIR